LLQFARFVHPQSKLEKTPFCITNEAVSTKVFNISENLIYTLSKIDQDCKRKVKIKAFYKSNFLSDWHTVKTAARGKNLRFKQIVRLY